MKRLFPILLSALLFAEGARATSPAFREGAKAPAFEVEMLDGATFRLTKNRGRVVVLAFWATWCRPCLRELGEVPEKLLRRFEGRPVVFLAVDRGEPRKTVEKRVAELETRGIVFPVALDPYEKLSDGLGDDRLPQLVVIDRRGVVRLHAVGYTPERLDDVAALVENLLDE
ncbi:MAG: TlpA family protein disulfide reductase [Alistipes sp.]|nr:TlpA family protein disulfide reductase [Alistipes sp.]